MYVNICFTENMTYASLFLDTRQKVGSSENVEIPFLSSRIRILKELGFYTVRNANLG